MERERERERGREMRLGASKTDSVFNRKSLFKILTPNLRLSKIGTERPNA